MTTPTIKEFLTLAEASTVSAPQLGVAPCSPSGFWRSARGENHGRDSRPGDVWCEPSDITDTDRLNWLEERGTMAGIYTEAELPVGTPLRPAIDRAMLYSANVEIRGAELAASPPL